MTLQTLLPAVLLASLSVVGCQKPTGARAPASDAPLSQAVHAPDAEAPAVPAVPRLSAVSDGGPLSTATCRGLERTTCSAAAGCGFDPDCCGGACLPQGEACPATCPSSDCSDQGPPPMCASKGGCVVPVQCVNGKWVCGPADSCDR